MQNENKCENGRIEDFAQQRTPNASFLHKNTSLICNPHAVSLGTDASSKTNLKILGRIIEIVTVFG